MYVTVHVMRIKIFTIMPSVKKSKTHETNPCYLPFVRIIKNRKKALKKLRPQKRKKRSGSFPDKFMTDTDKKTTNVFISLWCVCTLKLEKIQNAYNLIVAINLFRLMRFNCSFQIEK